MANNKFSIQLSINNIGPHYAANRIEFSDEINSNKAIFFATNGTGKSFISRAFRLTSLEKQNLIANDLLTIGRRKSFEWVK